jgi:signal transduction histidine kinase
MTQAIEASRARLVAAADEARRRLERDLHDGAQERLVIAALMLERAAMRTVARPAAPLVAEALHQVRQGLAELRELAHGIHPAGLSECGLAAALAALVARSPVPVKLRVTPQRAAPTVEAAIYFTIAEALTNIAKHAHATRASVTVDASDPVLVAEILDDGVGGAHTTGSGLRGFADRLEAVGGTLEVESPPGRGTRIRAHAPLLSPSLEEA